MNATNLKINNTTTKQIKIRLDQKPKDPSITDRNPSAIKLIKKGILNPKNNIKLIKPNSNLQYQLQNDSMLNYIFKADTKIKGLKASEDKGIFPTLSSQNILASPGKNQNKSHKNSFEVGKFKVYTNLNKQSSVIKSVKNSFFKKSTKSSFNNFQYSACNTEINDNIIMSAENRQHTNFSFDPLKEVTDTKTKNKDQIRTIRKKEINDLFNDSGEREVKLENREMNIKEIFDDSYNKLRGGNKASTKPMSTKDSSKITSYKNSIDFKNLTTSDKVEGPEELHFVCVNFSKFNKQISQNFDKLIKQSDDLDLGFEKTVDLAIEDITIE